MDDRQLMKFFARLTRRQQEVLQLTSEGLTNKEIGRRLFVEPSVVAGHLTTIYEELFNFVGFEESERPKRYAVIRLFSTFFFEHPELQIAASQPRAQRTVPDARTAVD